MSSDYFSLYPDSIQAKVAAAVEKIAECRRVILEKQKEVDDARGKMAEANLVAQRHIESCLLAEAALRSLCKPGDAYVVGDLVTADGVVYDAENRLGGDFLSKANEAARLDLAVEEATRKIEAWKADAARMNAEKARVLDELSGQCKPGVAYIVGSRILIGGRLYKWRADA